MTQAERLTPRQLVRVGANFVRNAEALYNAVDILNDDSIMGDSERDAIIDACATLQRVGMRANSMAHAKECDLMRVHG